MPQKSKAPGSKKSASASHKSRVTQPKTASGILSSPTFAKLYVLGALTILFLTTVFWSLLSARLQQQNADQLINSLLFSSRNVFHGALFAGQHTFLLKWPLFWVIALFGSAAWATVTATVGLAVTTVAGLVFILHRIEKRALVFGTLCLALASVLLMIPAQPYAGGLLPVNMAMLSTRNLEYLLYVGALILLVKAARLKSWRFLSAILLLVLLFSSDKLFLTISLASAAVALLVYTLLQAWKTVTLSARWVVASLLGGAGATIVLAIINSSGLTHIVNQSSVGPYGLIHSFHDFALGSFYAILGLFTNFGANPANNYSVLRNVPSQAYHGLVGIGGIPYIINALLFVGALYAVYWLVRTTLGNSRHNRQLTSAAGLASMLVWTSLAALAVFIFSQHDYAVDSRYLAISLFALFVTSAVYLRTKRWQPHVIVIAGLVITIGMVFGIFATLQTYHRESAALSTVAQRNSAVGQALQHHSVSTLVGDYWRVVPAKLTAQDTLNISPLANCTQVRDTLTSTAWQTNLHTHSFAYLLSLDKSLTNFPSCSIKQVVSVYGKPDQSTLIAGTLSNPHELLLFYDHGIPASPPAAKASEPQRLPATILPISLADLTGTICSKPTIMNVVAHEDDDLLFMNPDLQHSIDAGNCVRTVYITAGDAGKGQFYWLDREQGSEAAYSHMLGSNAVWIQKIIQLAPHEYVTIANPKDNTRVSLIFMHLPDGNLTGSGFQASHFQSLSKLLSGNIKTFNSVDGQSYYSLSQLTNALTSLMHAYQPATIRTQANFVSSQYPDHSDHIAVGSVVTSAYKLYEQQQYGNQVTIPIKYYIGYPIHAMAANVSGTDLQQKESTFLIYTKHDGADCQTLQQCVQTPTYGSYLTRQYQYKS